MVQKGCAVTQQSQEAPKPQESRYSALLLVKALLLPPEGEGEVGRLLALGRAFPIPGEGLSRWAKKGQALAKRVAKIRQSLPEGQALEVWATLYPRTQEGRLQVEAVQLNGFLPAEEEPFLPERGFRVLGLLVGWPGERLEVEVRPNRDGRLPEPFTLTLWTGPSLRGKVPIPGEEEALELQGRVDEEGRLWVEKVQVVPRPPEKAAKPKGGTKKSPPQKPKAAEAKGSSHAGRGRRRRAFPRNP